MPKHKTADDEWGQLVETWVRGMLGLFLDPFGIGKSDGESTDLRSPVFTVGASTTTRSLALQGDLVPGIRRTGSDEALPAKCVRFEPPQLGPTDSSFTLRVDAADATDCPGATYWGYANLGATTPVGAGGPGLFSPAETVRVWIVVP